MEQVIQLYKSKVTICTTHINKFLEEDQLLVSTIKDPKAHSKTFVTNTLKRVIDFHKQSTKTFTNTEYELFSSIAKIWKKLEDSDKVIIWRLLFEMFVLSVQVFPVVKQTNYSYINILLTLKTMDTDITLPELTVLHIVSGCLKETMKRMNTEIKEKKISDNLMDRLGEEIQNQDITTPQQLNQMKGKLKDMIKRDEVQYILGIIKEYFNEMIIDVVKTECSAVFNSEKFKNCLKKYNKTKIMSMIQGGEMTFSYIRQVIEESGLRVLLGDDFEFPTNFEECKTLIEKYTGQKFDSKDIKTLFKDNIKQVMEIPQVKKTLKKSGFNDIFGQFMSFFETRDYEKEAKERAEKRQKKKLKKLMKENKKKKK